MTASHEIAFRAFGVPVVVGASSPDLLSRIARSLPPGWEADEGIEAEQHFTLLTEDGVTYLVRFDGGTIAASSDLEVALDVFESQLRAYVALNAPDLVFVHAGVVALGDRAILIPGVSFSGKSTLVAELVRAGATYYSDEYAVLDSRGRTLPYAKPVSLRHGTLSQQDYDVSELGGVAGDRAVPVGFVVVTRYLPGVEWKPRMISAGQGALALLANAIPARTRPVESLAVITRTVGGTTVLAGDRGDAAPVVEHILALLA